VTPRFLPSGSDGSERRQVVVHPPRGRCIRVESRGHARHTKGCRRALAGYSGRRLIRQAASAPIRRGGAQSDRRGDPQAKRNEKRQAQPGKVGPRGAPGHGLGVHRLQAGHRSQPGEDPDHRTAPRALAGGTRGLHAPPGKAACHRRRFGARNVQASRRSRRGLLQRLEHPTATSLLPLRCFQAVRIPRSH
jgi:hypothetical protein